MNTRQFQQLMQTIADGWNNKNAKRAAACFTDDAVYMEPPDKQFFKGRDQLYEYFGGDNGFDMKLIWHNLFFDEEKQIGSGEYTFEMKNINHGVAVVELEGEKIKIWREYNFSGNVSYEEFLKVDGKVFQFTIKDLLTLLGTHHSQTL